MEEKTLAQQPRDFVKALNTHELGLFSVEENLLTHIDRVIYDIWIYSVIAFISIVSLLIVLAIGSKYSYSNGLDYVIVFFITMSMAFLFSCLRKGIYLAELLKTMRKNRGRLVG